MPTTSIATPAPAPAPIIKAPGSSLVSAWPKDNTAAKNAFYGNFKDPAWASLYLVRIHPQFVVYYAGKPMPAGILVNKKCAGAMLAAFDEIWDQCGHDQKAVDKTGASDYAGCLNIRPIAGSKNWSNHAWAAAIDLSPATNGFNMKGTLPSLVITAFKRTGALWGGDYIKRKDPMHFEYVSR